MSDTEPHIDLLRDSAGTYGVGIVRGSGAALPIILRPDCIYEGDTPAQYRAALQRITLAPCFRRTLEADLVNLLHQKFLTRHNLAAGYECEGNRQELRNEKERRLYFGTRKFAVSTVNLLISKLIEEVASASALKLARRYPFEVRLLLYRNFVLSDRAMQLSETFPVLATMLYGSGPFCLSEKERQEYQAARQMVEDGAKLKDIAHSLDVPMCLKKVRPGVSHWGLNVLPLAKDDPSIFHSYLPSTQHQMRIWLSALGLASLIGVGGRYLRWVAKNALQLGRTCEAARNLTSLIGDWALASEQPDQNEFGAQAVRRRFNPGMSVDIATELSLLWHREIVHYNSEIELGNIGFPTPWLEGMEIGEYEICPLTDVRQLQAEGRSMGHCVGTYASRIVHNNCYIYSVRKGTESIATLELRRSGKKFELAQLRGHGNAVVPEKIKGISRQWLRNAKPVPLEGNGNG